MGIYNAWTRIFQINYVVGAPVAALAYLGLCRWRMPPGRGVQVDLDEQAAVVEGVGSSAAVAPGSSKVADIEEKITEDASDSRSKV
jgi:hypothetical protein